MPVVRVMLGDGHRFTRVSIQDVPLARSVRWHYTKGYAHNGPSGLYLARLLLGLQKGDPRHADHINHNPLDNFRSNLRAVSASENMHNRRNDGYRGVSWHAKSGKWLARVMVDRKQHYLGIYADREEAARVAREARARLMSGSLN